VKINHLESNEKLALSVQEFLLPMICRYWWRKILKQRLLRIAPIKGTYSRLLNQSHEVPFPTTSDKLVLANEMGSFFVEKIDTIHAKLDRRADCFFMIPILTM